MNSARRCGLPVRGFCAGIERRGMPKPHDEVKAIAIFRLVCCCLSLLVAPSRCDCPAPSTVFAELPPPSLRPPVLFPTDRLATTALAVSRAGALPVQAVQG